MDEENGRRRLLPSNLNSKDKECDFYLNPTILSRLIQNFKYRAAVERLEKRGPAEASVWVCTKRKTDSKKSSSAANSLTSSIISHAREGYGYRQLPIHMACESLYRVADQSLRADLESLIAHLVIAYSDGCSRRDHEGRLPLHEAIWHGASPETVSALLMAYPKASQEKDVRGRYPVEINEHRSNTHKEAIRSLLRRKDDFWVAAGKEAHLRLKHRRVPAADASVASTSVLGSSVKEDDDTLVSNESFDFSVDPSHPKASNKYAGHVKAMKWTQIEKRAMTLESKLAESYEQNYKLKQHLTELNVSKKLLQKKVDKLMENDHAKQIAELVMEKEDLHMQIEALQARLSKNGLPTDYPSESSHPETLQLPGGGISGGVGDKLALDKAIQELSKTKAEYARSQEEKEKEIWELEKKMEKMSAEKDDQIKTLEDQVEDLVSHMATLQTSPSNLTDRALSDFTKSLGSDDETISTEGSSGPSTPSRPGHDDDEEVDAVLQNAIRLNGGQGLSPRLVEMWNKVNLHTQSLGRISEDASYDQEDDFRREGNFNEERKEEEEEEERKEEVFPALYDEAASRYNVHEVSALSMGSCQEKSKASKESLLVPTLDHKPREYCKDISVPPRNLSKDVSDLTMSVTGPMWKTKSKSATVACPRNISKEVSELTMSVYGDGYGAAPTSWSLRDTSHLQEISELTMNY